MGDGTTSVVVICAELLKEAKQFLEDGMPCQCVIRGYRKAVDLCIGKLNDLAVDLGQKSAAEKREMLIKCAETTLSSKLVITLLLIFFAVVVVVDLFQIFSHKTFFAEMVVSAVSLLDEDLPLSMIGIKKVWLFQC